MQALFTVTINNALCVKKDDQQYHQYFPIFLDTNSVIFNSSKIHFHSVEALAENRL